MPASTNSPISVCLSLTRAISRARLVEEIYGAALDALEAGLGVSRASVQLFDRDGVMRFKAFRGLSEAYRKAVEGHTPWTPDSPDPQLIVVPDVRQEASLRPYHATLAQERITALTFIPLVNLGRVVGKFMLYYDEPRVQSHEELELAGVIAAQVAFAIERTRAETKALRSEEQLRFALDAASMGTWDWDLTTNVVRWSENLARIHGLPAGAFDGTFSSYEREIHPEDRERVFASIHRAVEEGGSHDVEYRIVAPDGTIRWVEGKGRVEHENGRPVRMSGVCMIVTRRKEAELARLTSAEEASRLKDEFLATLSHELRTPLNAILGWTQMLQDNTLAAARARQAINTIARNAKLQAQLIEDILDVSRIVSGKLEVEHVTVFLPHLLDTAIDAVLPAAAAKHIVLSKDYPSQLPAIEGDPKRLHQVLGNLLSNSIKFTPDGGRVRVVCRASRDIITIEVTDSGVGIAPEFLPFIFDRFRQADSRTTRKHGGLGLGLAITRHIVEQHQGEIYAFSDGSASGTTFRVRLPIGSFVGAPPVAEGTPENAQHLRLAGLRVLVVDDQADSRELLAAIFDRCGAVVLLRDSAASALELLQSTDVNLLIADIAMPDVDGYEFIERVRRLGERLGRVPAIAVTAYARLEDRHRAVAAGYDGYCPKPVDAAELLRVAEDVIGDAAESVRSS